MEKPAENRCLPTPQELVYRSPEGGPQLGIKLILPNGPVRATIVYAHGGGFSHGSRNDKMATLLALKLQDENIAVASIDYRKKTGVEAFPKEQVPLILDAQDRTQRVGLRINPNYCGPFFYAALEDYSDALDYLKSHADDLGLGQRFVALGASAGGIAALSLAYPPRGPWQGLTRPDAAMGISAAMVQPWRLAQGGPPAVMMNSYHDGVISPHNTRVLARKAAHKDAPVKVVTTPIRGHKQQVDTFLNDVDETGKPYLDLLRHLT
jgi:alpha-beta hydrolase superfamily lysophospholipase